MNYNGNIYRPPIEAHTLLIPVTEGCTHNRCTFCNMYQNVPFRMWTLDEAKKRIETAIGNGCTFFDTAKVYVKAQRDMPVLFMLFSNARTAGMDTCLGLWLGIRPNVRKLSGSLIIK